MTEVERLQEQLEMHKVSLKQVDESIKKLSGSDEKHDFKKSSEHENSSRQRVNKVNSRDEFESNGKNSKRKVHEDQRGSKRLGNTRSGVHDLESGGEEDDLRKPTIQSSVVSSSMPIKSKEDLIKIQNKYNGSQERNKRIFGVILGTLKQFKSDDKERSETTQAINRKELEKKIEVKKVEEKKRIADEKKRLEEEKSKQIRSIEILEQKIQLTEHFEEWKNNQIQYKKFIRTQSKPFVFYLPKELEANGEKLLAETAALIDEQIGKKLKETEEELERLGKEVAELNRAESDNKENKKEAEKGENASDIEMDEEEKNDVRIGDDDEDDEMSAAKKATTESSIEDTVIEKTAQKAGEEEKMTQEDVKNE